MQQQQLVFVCPCGDGKPWALVGGGVYQAGLAGLADLSQVEGRGQQQQARSSDESCLVGAVGVWGGNPCSSPPALHRARDSTTAPYRLFDPTTTQR